MLLRALTCRVNAAALAAVATISLACPASAQQRDKVELALTVGAFVPMRHLFPPSFATTGECSKFPEDPQCGGPGASPRLMQRTAVAVGGRVTSWLGYRGALEEWVWVSPSGVTGTVNRAGTILVAGMRGVYRLVPGAATTSLLIMGGPAVILRFGGYWDAAPGAYAPAGTLGIAVDLHPDRPFRLRSTLEEYLYRVNTAFQNDFVLSLSIRRSGRRGESQR
jgi:hypothetical protein